MFSKTTNESFRDEIAKDMGVYGTAKIEGWAGAIKKGGIVTRTNDFGLKNLNK